MDYSTAWENKILIPRADDETASAAHRIEKSDAQLVELVLSGDETAFEQIFDRYKRLVAAIAARYFRRHEEIDEIIQISFSRAYFQLRYFRGGHDASFAGWIGKIATNACLDTLRTQTRKPENLLCELSDAENEILLTDTPQTDKTAEKSLVERDLAEKLLSHLKPQDRAILQMLDAEGMSVNEVAEITGWSKSKIKIRAFRARNALRKVLKKFL